MKRRRIKLKKKEEEIIEKKNVPKKVKKKSHKYDEEDFTLEKEDSLQDLKEELRRDNLACYLSQKGDVITDRYYFCSHADCKVVKYLRQYGNNEVGCELYTIEKEHHEECKQEMVSDIGKIKLALDLAMAGVKPRKILKSVNKEREKNNEDPFVYTKSIAKKLSYIKNKSDDVRSIDNVNDLQQFLEEKQMQIF